MRCVALFLIQELSPEGYAWTGNALRGAAPCSGMVSKRLFLDWEHAAAPPAQPEPAQPAPPASNAAPPKTNEEEKEKREEREEI